MFNGRDKNKRRMNVFLIMPSVPYVNGIVANLKFQKLKELYNKVMEIVETKEKMSAVFGINETDDKRLIKTFIEQYANLWPILGDEQIDLFSILN